MPGCNEGFLGWWVLLCVRTVSYSVSRGIQRLLNIGIIRASTGFFRAFLGRPGFRGGFGLLDLTGLRRGIIRLMIQIRPYP